MNKTKEKKEVHWMTWHGVLGDEKWPLPQCVVKSSVINRKDQKSKIDSSEYLDDPDVLNKKMEKVAEILKKSKFTVAYTGAGISRGAGIPDYASKAKDSLMSKVEKLKNPADALPTYSHYVLSNLEKNGFLHYYVQQNHDGLPQKAGFPQEKMNEIHGAWFDPSNPVVQFSENLRTDLFNQMLEAEEKAQFCMCLGTSLSGMNADRMVTTPSEKFAGGVEDCYGSVIVNLQFTPIDIPGYIPIRVWAKIDDAMKLLMKHLDLKMEKIPIKEVKGDKIVCSYNKDGFFDETKKMVFDFSLGKKIKIVQKGAKTEGQVGTVYKKDPSGNYIVNFNGRLRRLGKWWLSSIKNGKFLQIPFVNEKPTFIKKESKKEKEKKK